LLSARVVAPLVRVLFLRLMPKRELLGVRREEGFLPLCERRLGYGAQDFPVSDIGLLTSGI
jgi:hypothetical protein